MPERIPQSATIRVPLKAYLSSDHISPATSKTIAITISKNGAAYGNPSGGATNATEIASGSYYVDLSTTDAGTLGPLFILGTASGVDPVEVIYDVVKATNAGLSAIPDTACTTNASLPTSGTGTDQISLASGRIDVGKTLGTAITLDANNVINVSAKYWAGTAISAGSIPVATAAGAAGGLFIAGTNAATVITTSLTTHLIGTVDTVTNLTNAPTAGDFTTTMKTSITAAVPAAATIATATWQDATAGDFTAANSIGKSLYTGIAPGTVLGLPIIGRDPFPASGTIVGRTWDEILTTGTHNVALSAGRLLRLINPNSDTIYPPSGAGPVNLTAATSTTATLDASASAGSQAYQFDVLNILTGTGAGQSRPIINYTTGRVATVNPPFTTTPDTSSTFDITPTASVQVLSYYAGQDPATLVLDAVLSAHLTAGTTGAAINAAGASLNAAGIRSAIGMASANLDTQLGGLSTYAGGPVASVTGNVGGNLLGSLSAAERNAIADAHLVRDWTAVAGVVADRSTLNALRFLRNGWSLSGSTLTVFNEAGGGAWTMTVTATPGADPVTATHPS